MYRHTNFRILLIRLLITTCFVGGITSAPIDTEINGDSGRVEAEDAKEEILPSESKLTENVNDDSRALNIPFVSSLPNPFGGKENSGSAGLPGFPGLPPGFSSVIANAKLYLGTFQVMEVPKIGDMLGSFGQLENLIKPPTLPGLSNLIPGSADTSSTP